MKFLKKFTFENSIKRLEEISSLLQKGDTDLEESLKLYEEGTKLAAKCYNILKKAEQKVKTVELIDEKD
ncbi:MAG: exodeoxyribonuclease VII small subunit [Oscillospiraceae bacterium]|nr:exodeoxyribonuclease VII small subunit [Oscillospiraceae bacterium]